LRDNVQIRPAVATDLPGLMGLDHSSSSDYVWQLDLRKENGQISAGFREVRLPRPVSVTYPRDPFALADEWTQRSATFIALAWDVPVGYVCVLEHSHATTAWVTDLIVDAGSRRKGIGSALLNAAQDWASSRGDKDIFLEMPSKSHSAIRLAHKFGFEFCGYNDHYYVTKDVALFFGRSLL
jgi:ribosomal protein S18 acetylase RimI-like enzyme